MLEKRCSENEDHVNITIKSSKMNPRDIIEETGIELNDICPVCGADMNEYSEGME